MDAGAGQLSGGIVVILPIWFGVILGLVGAVIGAAGWVRRKAVTEPAAARSVRDGARIADHSIEESCRSAVARHELAAVGRMDFDTSVPLLSFEFGKHRGRAPAHLMLSGRTLGISYKKGSLGDVATILINRRDVRCARARHGPEGWFCSIETAQGRILAIHLRHAADQPKHLAWPTPS